MTLRHILAFLLLLAPGAWAQTVEYGPAWPQSGIATGGTTADTIANLAAYTLNIKAHGAKCDGTTDDAAAINAATAAARTLVNANKTVRITGPVQQSCLISSTINMTGFTGAPVIWDMPTILCQTSGTQCVDASGSRWVHWASLSIKGLQTNAPNIGLQVARIATAQGNEHQADHIWLFGYFTFAGMYNEAVEVSQWNHVIIFNQYADANSYALVMDGDNHWNAQSAFATIGLPVDTLNSFNDNTFIGGDFQQVGGGASIWMEGTSGHRYIGSYAESIGGVANVVLYDNGHGGNTDLKFDHLHGETNIADMFLVSGTNATPILRGFMLDDFFPEATNSIFKLDTGVTGVTMRNPHITIENSQTVPIKLFDAPSAWTVLGGYIWLPHDSYWSGPPALFTGCLATADSSGCGPTNAGAPGNMVANGDMAIDQQNNGAKQSTVRYVDRWTTDFRGGIASGLKGQRIKGGAPAGFGYYLGMTANAGISVPTAAQASNLRQFIEASFFNASGWGGSAASPLTCGFYARANNTGNYPIAVVNSAANRSYVTTFPIATASAWLYSVLTIPGDTSGSWSTGADAFGATLYFNMAGGSNFQTTAGSWQAGLFFTTATAAQLATIASATLDITAVHCNFGPIDLGYPQLPYPLELARAQRFYTKSLEQSIAVAQNAGAAGAVDIQLPYAQTTFGSVSVPVRFPVTLFLNAGTTLPTMTFYSPSAASANCYNETQARDSGAASASDIGDGGFMLTCALIAGDAVGDKLSVQYTADSTF